VAVVHYKCKQAPIPYRAVEISSSRETNLAFYQFLSVVNHIISYIILTNVLEHTSALTVAQKHNETFQRNNTELKS